MTSGTTHRMPGTLPPQTTGFVGRQAEIAQVSVALMESRLVTIAGTGGVGKTRVAVRVAAQTTGRYPDGVHLVELSAVRDPRLLASTVAASLGLPAEDARPQLDAVLDYLRERALLLILDTCEHLVDACAALAGAVLSAAPAVTLLATSRQPLDVRARAPFSCARCPFPTSATRRRTRTRSSCSPSGPRPSSTGSRSPPRTAPTSSRSAGRSTASRWRSSSPPCGCGRCRSTRWPAASTTGFTCSPAASGPGCRGTRRCGPRSNGATTSARRPSRWSGRGCRSSRAPSTSPRRRRCARTAS